MNTIAQTQKMLGYGVFYLLKSQVITSQPPTKANLKKT